MAWVGRTKFPEIGVGTLPIRLSPTATSRSVRPCSWTFTSVAIFGSHNRCQSSSDFSLTDAACAGYLEKARWSDGFVCPHCQAAGEPFRFANRPGVLRCRKCRRDTGFDGGNGHGALAHAAERMVLVCLSGVQPNTRHVGRAASATTWPVAGQHPTCCGCG